MARAKRQMSSTKMDLTPMIDCVFQLIIFFILTMNITSQEFKSVQLPTAISVVDPPPKDDILMLHIFNALGDRKNPLAMPPAEGWHVTMPKRKEEFREVNDLAPKVDEKAQQWNASHPVNEFGNSTMEVLVRGDMRAPSHYFAVILAACQRAKVFRVKVSIKPPPQN